MPLEGQKPAEATHGDLAQLAPGGANFGAKVGKTIRVSLSFDVWHTGGPPRKTMRRVNPERSVANGSTETHCNMAPG